MKIKKGVISIILLMFLSTCMLYAKGERPFIMRGVRPLGMGGAHIGLSDDQNAFFYNPAGIVKRRRNMLTMFQLRLGISDDVLKFYDWAKENEDELKNFDDQPLETKERIIDEIADKITKYKTRVLFNSPNINFISGPRGKNGKTFWGWGVFDQLDIGFKMNPGILVPNVDIWGNADAAGMLMFAHKFPFEISGGINVKYLGRLSIQEDRKSILAFEDFDPTLQPGTGWGIDVGALWEPRRDITLGMQISDFAGTKIKYDEVKEDKELADGTTESIVTEKARTGIINPRLNMGITYKPLRKIVKILFMPDVTFALDFRDVTDRSGDGEMSTAEFFKNVHTGVEFAWKFLAVRTGLNSGYPTMGFGFYLWSLKFDYAYYTDENGMFPGDIPETNHIAALTWRFGKTLTKKDFK